VIAVLDTGITAHSDLAGRTVAGYDFVSDIDISNDGNARDSDASDPGDWLTQAEINANPSAFSGCAVENSSWHGTHAAGIIGAVTNNAAGIAGVNWVSKIQPIRVLGKCYGLTSDIAAAIVWAAGGTVAGVATNPCETTYRNAVAQAATLGAVVVVAAGNETAGAAGSAPANCPGAISVSALDIDGFRAGYSNYGAPATLSAPGGDASTILSTLNAGITAPGAESYGGLVGTSFAAPHVAGVASLMLSVRPTLQPHHVIALMRGTASPYRSLTVANSFYDCSVHPCGDGLVNAAAAVAAAQACTTPPSGTAAAISETCNGDYDGNGVVSALTDGIIATRLSLGMTGNAVVAGALGACASRTTYAAIRAYSNRNCGTNYAP
jgi:serine protease